jgi:hypothetical protein
MTLDQAFFESFLSDNDPLVPTEAAIQEQQLTRKSLRESAARNLRTPEDFQPLSPPAQDTSFFQDIGTGFTSFGIVTGIGEDILDNVGMAGINKEVSQDYNLGFDIQ